MNQESKPAISEFFATKTVFALALLAALFTLKGIFVEELGRYGVLIRHQESKIASKSNTEAREDTSESSAGAGPKQSTRIASEQSWLNLLITPFTPSEEKNPIITFTEPQFQTCVQGLNTGEKTETVRRCLAQTGSDKQEIWTIEPGTKWKLRENPKAPSYFIVKKGEDLLLIREIRLELRYAFYCCSILLGLAVYFYAIEFITEKSTWVFQKLGHLMYAFALLTPVLYGISTGGILIAGFVDLESLRVVPVIISVIGGIFITIGFTGSALIIVILSERLGVKEESPNEEIHLASIIREFLDKDLVWIVIRFLVIDDLC